MGSGEQHTMKWRPVQTGRRRDWPGTLGQALLAPLEVNAFSVACSGTCRNGT